MLAQGGYLKAGGTFIKGGSRVLSMKLAKAVMRQGGTVLLGREANGIDFDGSGHPTFVRHRDSKTKEDEQRLGARQVFANCAPHVLAHILADAQRAKVEHAYVGQPLSTSAFSAHFGLSVPPAKLGLERYEVVVAQDGATSLNQYGEDARMLASNPGNRLPGYGITNYGAIDSGLEGDGLVLVCVAGLDRFDNWAALAPEDEKDRRERWLDAFQTAVDHEYPGFSAAVAERMFLNARSMHNFMNTPSGAITGFAPIPYEHSILSGFPRSPKTPISGLYLASSFAGGGGFSGAMMSGANAARIAMKERTH